MANLRNRSGFWMEVQVAITENNEKGIPKEVKERYTVEAATFIDAENRIRKELDYSNRPIKKVCVIQIPKYGTVCFSDDPLACNWYKVKVCITEEIEVKTRKGGIRTKQKVVSHIHLIQSASVESARRAIPDAVYKDSNADYEISDVVKTRILDVLENDKHLKSTEVK